MNPVRLPFALGLLAPAALAAADGGAVPDRPFAEVRKDLSELKTPVPGTVTMPALDLGAAAGIGSGPKFTAPTPPAPQPAPAKADPGVVAQRPASSGWLLDAWEENSRRARADGNLPAPKGDLTEAAEERRSDPRPGAAASNPRREPASPDRTALPSPLSAYLAAWLNPEEYRRLQNLYPEMTDLPGGKDVTPAVEPSARAAAPGVAGTTGEPNHGLGGFADQNRAANANPFVQALQSTPRPAAAAPAAQVERPRIAAPVTAIPAAPEASSPARVAVPSIPEAPGADDRKYFPQLKRF